MAIERERGCNTFYGRYEDGSLWIDREWAIDRLIETYHIQLLDMDRAQLIEEYVEKFGEPHKG